MPLRRELLWLALGLVLLLAWDSSTLDQRIVGWYGDAGGFRWRDHWFTSQLLHQGGRWLGLGLLAGMIAGLFHPRPWQPARAGLLETRGLRVWTVFTVLLCLLVISGMKRYSLTSCPWSLAEFGGPAHFVSHWRWGVADGGDGHCFPSGHASSAFALLAGTFALRLQGHGRAARCWLALVLPTGLVFGWTQVMRGAHYPSHSLWTAWICWGLSTLSLRLWTARRRGAAAPRLSRPGCA